MSRRKFEANTTDNHQTNEKEVRKRSSISKEHDTD